MRFLSASLLVTIVLAASAAAWETSLDGTWEGCFRETASAPGPDARWTPIVVPSLIDRIEGKSFLWCRRSFDTPAEAAGKRLFLRVGASRFVTTVLVNGTEMGSHYGGWEPFELEITDACRPEGTNELLVRVQDVTGVIAEDMSGKRPPRGVRYIDQADDSVMAPVGSRYTYVGIWQPVTLFTRDDVFVDDVFVKTSVRNRSIEVDYTIRNLAAETKTVTVTSEVLEGVSLGRRTLSVPAGASSTVTLSALWREPRLWGPEDPHLYHLVTRLSEGSESRDVVDTRFGFREFWTEGDKLILNGTPMNFLATAGHPRGSLDGALSKPSALDFYRRIREAGCVAMRLHANLWPKTWYEAADEVGMPLVIESALFCYARAYALSNDAFWNNYHDHLRAILKDHRNHPSIVMISLENEILHCGGNRVPETEHRLAEAGRLVKRLDPTRPILYDGDGDPEGVADVVNLHYPLDFDRRNLWPDAGYWLESGMEVSGWPRTFFDWDRTKPLYFGEFLHLQHYREADPYSVLIGNDAYQGHDRAMALAKAAAWEMQIEAYRACGVSGMCPWTLTETGEFPSDDNPRYRAVKRAYEKNAAFVREYDARFFSGERVARTVHVYNDTLHPATLALDWKLLDDRSVVDSGRERFDLEPAGRQQVTIAPTMPEVEQPSPVRLSLTVLRDGKPVYESQKRYRVYPRRPLDVPEGLRLALYEGQDRTLSRALADAGVTPLRVGDLADLPEAHVLLIGPHALDGLKPSDGPPVVGGPAGPRQALADFVWSGGSVVVLEQASYDHGLFPATLVDRGATIAFERMPALDGQEPKADERGAGDDEAGSFAAQRGPSPLCFWRGDHVVLRKAIAKPSQGRFRTLVDSGGPQGLVYVGALELPEGRGRYLLSQLAIGEKLNDEPMAQITLERLLRRAGSPTEAPVSLAVVEENRPLTDRVRDLDASFTDVSGRLGQVDLAEFGVLLAETDSSEVARHQGKIREFVEAGGRVILHGGSPRGIAAIQALFPEPLFAQRGSAVPARISRPDPAIDGLSNQELYWYGDRQGLAWRVRTPLSTALADYVIVAGKPDPAHLTVVEAESMEAESGDPRFDDESVSMWRTGAIRTKVEFPRSGRYAFLIRGSGTSCGGVYPQVELSIDGRPCGSVFTESTSPETYLLTAPVAEGERILGLAFVNDAHDPDTGEDRNVRLDRVAYGPVPSLESKPLVEPAVLVKVPLGKGFVLVDQVAWTEEERNAEKADRYASTLLTNLGCRFGARARGITIPPATMKPKRDFRFTPQDDGAAYLGSNGTIACRVRFAAAGKYEFVVRASGTEAGGAFPNVRVDLDDRPLGDLQLDKPGWHALRLEAPVAEGEHEVSLSFTNDFYDPPADRNLRVRSLMIRPAARSGHE